MIDGRGVRGEIFGGRSLILLGVLAQLLGPARARGPQRLPGERRDQLLDRDRRVRCDSDLDVRAAEELRWLHIDLREARARCETPAPAELEDPIETPAHHE